MCLLDHFGVFVVIGSVKVAVIDCADAAVLSQGGEFISSCLAKDNALRVSFVVKGCKGVGGGGWGGNVEMV